MPGREGLSNTDAMRAMISKVTSVSPDDGRPPAEAAGGLP
jgi:hypothetical protein